METKLTELTNIFKEIFDRQDIVLTNLTTAADIDGWDSITHISLIIAIEEHFGIRLTTSEIANLQHVGDMLELISKKLAAKS